MSGGGATKRAAQQSANITAEGQRSKEAAVQAVNKLFGEGDFRNFNDASFGGFTSPDKKGIYLKDMKTAAASPFLPSGITGNRFGSSLKDRRKKKEPILIPGEDPIAYEREKAAFESQRDANKKSREDLYAGNRNAVLDVNKDKLNRDLTESERQLQFSLARSGLFAGSEDINQHGKQRDAYDQGVLQSTSLADQSAAGFRSADERSRLDVINQIQGGADAGTALQNAQRGLELSAQNADANAKGNILGNVFGDAGLIYNNQNQIQGTEDGRTKYANQLGAFFNNNRTSYSGTKR